MNVIINNSAHELAEQSVLSDALRQLNISSRKGMALAVNNEVVPAAEWESYRLKENDKVIIIKATQGG